MIRHTVVFRLCHPPGSAPEADFLRAARDQLSPIPGVQRFEVLRQTGGQSAYRFSLSMEFGDAAAYGAYNEHPDSHRLRSGTLAPGGRGVPRARLRILRRGQRLTTAPRGGHFVGAACRAAGARTPGRCRRSTRCAGSARPTHADTRAASGTLRLPARALRRRELAAHAPCRTRTRRAVQVDGLPAQAEQLSRAKPRHRRGHVRQRSRRACSTRESTSAAERPSLSIFATISPLASPDRMAASAPCKASRFPICAPLFLCGRPTWFTQ